MCGRYTLTRDGADIVAHFGLAEYFQTNPRYNVSPKQQVLTISEDENGDRVPVMRRWGLVPSWAKDDKFYPINARYETVETKPMFRSAMKKRRCLVVADGFIEWREEGKMKYPFHF